MLDCDHWYVSNNPVSLNNRTQWQCSLVLMQCYNSDCNAARKIKTIYN